MDYPVIVSTSNLSVDPDTQKAIDEFNARQERLHDPAYLRTPEGKKEARHERNLMRSYKREMKRFERDMELLRRPLDPRIANERCYLKVRD